MSKNRRILLISTILALAMMPILLRRRYRKKSIIIFFLSAIFNSVLSHILIAKNYFSQPSRYFHKYFISNILYDWLVLPLIAVLYCQATASAGAVISTSYAVALSSFQALLEYWMLIDTSLIKYNEKKWSIWHTLITLILYKVILMKGTWWFLGKLDKHFKGTIIDEVI